MNVSSAIKSRWSARAFLDRPVSHAEVKDILDTARWAPSGSNIQPWRVEVVTGETKKNISAEMAAARAHGQPPRPDYDYYPKVWEEPFDARRKACGLALYGALAIGREDKEKRMAAWLANYHFFGAPVGLLFLMDRSLSAGSFIDTGLFLQSVMLAALERGMATCPQASMGEYPDIVRRILNLPDHLMVVCGMSLGWPDEKAPVNNYRTQRMAVDEFTRFHD